MGERICAIVAIGFALLWWFIIGLVFVRCEQYQVTVLSVVVPFLTMIVPGVCAVLWAHYHEHVRHKIVWDIVCVLLILYLLGFVFQFLTVLRPAAQRGADGSQTYMQVFQGR